MDEIQKIISPMIPNPQVLIDFGNSCLIVFLLLNYRRYGYARLWKTLCIYKAIQTDDYSYLWQPRYPNGKRYTSKDKT
jgi:hypothetical protein